MSTIYAPGDLSIGICDRCSQKVPYRDLRADGNSPGLRICQDAGCWDPRDPWRLPPIQPDPIVMRFPRPDVSVATTSDDTGTYDPPPGPLS
jgi:hypothetical protein